MPSIVSTVLIYGALLAVMWFFLIRPQKKKQDEVRKMRNSLGVGDEIITIGGIVGKIKVIKEDFIHLEVIKGCNDMVVSKWAVGEILKSKSKKNEKVEEPKEKVEKIESSTEEIEKSVDDKTPEEK